MVCGPPADKQEITIAQILTHTAGFPPGLHLWQLARTPEQIWENMYEIENPENDPTLLGYWKCNDASGNTVKDYSMYGNDGVAKYDIIWPQGIEIPKLNENNE